MQSSPVAAQPSPLLEASVAAQVAPLRRNNEEMLASHDVEAGSHDLIVTKIKEQFDQIFEARQQMDTGLCLKKIQDRSVKILASTRMENLMYVLIFGAWILLTTAASMELYYSLKNDKDKGGAGAAFGIGLTALIVQGCVAALWFVHRKIKGKAEEEKHDRELVDRFVRALKDHKLAAIETPHTSEPLPQDHLKSETRSCIQNYDNLPHSIKQKIPPRDLWIIGLIKGLPPEHPLQAKLQRMLSTATQMQQDSQQQASVSDGEGTNHADASEIRKGKDIRHTLQEHLQSDLEEIEKFVGCRTNLVEALTATHQQKGS